MWSRSQGRIPLSVVKTFKSLVSATAVISMLSGCVVRPIAYSEHDAAIRAEKNIANLTLHQETISSSVGLHEAMARALKYNLDLQVKEAQTQLASAQLDLAHYSMLPDLVVNSGYVSRNNLYASQSLDLATGSIDPSSSSSQDKTRYTSDITFSWNVLDFGLSYVRAQQAADRYLISQEMRRSIGHSLLEKVRATHWRAVAHQRMTKKLGALEKRTIRAISDSRKLAKSNQVSRVEALTTERELLKIRRAIKSIQKDHMSAKSELARLMNLKPGTAFKLSETAKTKLPSHPPMSAEEMMFAAARDRPEMREIMYRQRIQMSEIKGAMLEILPGFSTYASSNWDSNSFLLNDSWFSWGSTIGWSLLKLFQYPASRYAAEAQEALLEKQALAMTMTVMTQVHLSRLRYQGAKGEYEVAKEFRSVQSRLADLMRAEARANRISDQKLLIEELNALVAEVKYDLAYAQYQAAYAGLFASIGADPIVLIHPGATISEIASVLSQDWNQLSQTQKKQGSGTTASRVQKTCSNKNCEART